MIHIEQGELQAYLDEEATLGARAHIDSHVEACAACAAELDRMRAASALFATAIRGADTQAPVFAAQAAVSAARRQARRQRFAFSRGALLRAALFMIGFAALASAAIPGSPVRSWISTALRSMRITPAIEIPARRTPDARAITPTVESVTGAAALSIRPVDGRVRVVLTDVAFDANIHVRLYDGDRAVVQASGAASRARFRTSPGRLELVGVGNGEVTIDLPRSATDARVEADGRVLYPKSNDPSIE